MEQRPTKKQRELLAFIDGFIKGNGYGPSYREIMRALGYKSVSTVATHVDNLIARGWLAKKDNSARTLEVVTHGSQALPAAAADGVEQAIRKKIAALTDLDAEKHAKDIETLESALEIMGYQRAHRTELS